MDNPFLGISQALLFNKKLLLELTKEIQELKSNQSNSIDLDRYIDKKEAADIAGVSLSTINNWRRAKKVKVYYFDSIVRFHYGEFLEFLAQKANYPNKSG